MNDKFRHRKHTISFKNALSGLNLAFVSQPNFKIMLVATILVLIFSFLFNLSLVEWAIIIWTIMIVYIVEMINTSIEAMVDLITSEWKEDAKIAKDVSGGMALLAVIGSIIVGLLIFIPKLLSL